jgi:hypothetical protein
LRGSKQRKLRRLYQEETKEAKDMKWGGYDMHAGDRLSRAFAKIVAKRAVYYLMMVLALGLVLGAGLKWHG